MRGWTPFMIQSVPFVVGGRSILFIGMILRVFSTFYKHLRLPTKVTTKRPLGPTGWSPTHLRTPRNAETARTMSETRRTDAAVDRAAVFGGFWEWRRGTLLQQLASRTPEMDVGKSVFFFQMQVSIHAGLLGAYKLVGL